MSNPRIPYQMASDRARLTPPQPGKKLIVHVVVNVEYWPFDQPMPRKLLPGPHGNDKIPDVPNFSWVEYGMRTGFPRIVQALKSRGLPASTTINASVIDVYPRAAEVMLENGWEFMGHGWTQKALQTEPDEEAVIDRCKERIERFTGTHVRGWLGAGLSETMDTPDVLKSRGVRLCVRLGDRRPADMDAHEARADDRGPLFARSERRTALGRLGSCIRTRNMTERCGRWKRSKRN